MTGAHDPYYNRTEVSNSDLSALKAMFEGERVVGDKQAAYRFGTLLDCRITEPHKVNTATGECCGHVYTADEMALSLEMKKAFYRDEFCANLAKHCSFQKITTVPRFPLELSGFSYTLPARCKWDLFVEGFDMSGDIKTTAAETEKQFLEACYYFDYPRQRAWYMDLETAASGRLRSRDVLIGISKKNLRVFKLFINRGDKHYTHGRDQYQELAFKFWYLFADLKTTTEPR